MLGQAERKLLKIKNIKERYPHFELEIEQDATRTPVLIKQERK